MKIRLILGAAIALSLSSAAEAQFLNPPGNPSALAATLSATVASPAGQTSTAGVMMGLNQTMTPTTTGRIFYVITGDIINNTNSDGGLIQCRHGTSAAPAAGDPLTGTTDSTTPKFINAAASAEKVPFACQGVITGLALNKTIWLDLSIAAITGGTATASDVTVSAHEF